MKKQWITSLVLAFCLTTGALAQQPTQTTSNGPSSQSTQRNTSSREGLDRKGGKDVGTRGSQKMKDGVSRSGNSNLSPTSPTNPPPADGNASGTLAAKPAGGASGGTAGPANGTNAGNLKMADKSKALPLKPKGSGTRNGNTGSGTKPIQTQGSTSEGTASKPSPGGAVGTNTRVTRSERPKSRAAMEANKPQNQPASAAGQADGASKVGRNGEASKGATSTRLTERGQKEGSYSDAAKRNKTTEGVSKDPLKTGPNGQQTGTKKN